MFSGEPEDLQQDNLKRWLTRSKKYVVRLGLNYDFSAVADYYGAYTEGKAIHGYQMQDREAENLGLVQLKNRFQQLFEASTNTDDTYHKWQNVRRTAGGQPAHIMKVAGELADLKGPLPAGSITDYAQKPRFLDAIDSRLCRSLEPKLRLQDPRDQIVALAERYNAMMYRTSAYKGSEKGQASSGRPQTPNKENTYSKLSAMSTPRNRGKGKVLAKKRTSMESNIPCNGEMD